VLSRTGRRGAGAGGGAMFASCDDDAPDDRGRCVHSVGRSLGRSVGASLLTELLCLSTDAAYTEGLFTARELY